MSSPELRDAEIRKCANGSAGGPAGQRQVRADQQPALLERALQVVEPPAHLLGRLAVLTVAASEHRTQLANRKAARERLAMLVRRAAGPPPAKRRATKPTRGSQRRRLDAKKRRGEVKRGRSGDWS